MDKKLLGKKIKILRVEENLSQQDFARKISTTQNQISRWENGVCYPPTEKILEINRVFQKKLLGV